MSKLSKSTRSLKSAVNSRSSHSSEDEDIHLKDLSPEPFTSTEAGDLPASQHGSRAPDPARRASTASTSLRTVEKEVPVRRTASRSTRASRVRSDQEPELLGQNNLISNLVLSAGIANCVEPFKGRMDEDAEDWLDRFCTIARLNQWDQGEAWILRFRLYMEESAKIWWNALDKGIQSAKARIINAFREEFITKRQKNFGYYWQIIQRKQEKEEDPVSYARQLKFMMDRADTNMTEATRIHYLIFGPPRQVQEGIVEEGFEFI
jgi:hypothetical protein